MHFYKNFKNWIGLENNLKSFFKRQVVIETNLLGYGYSFLKKCLFGFETSVEMI